MSGKSTLSYGKMLKFLGGNPDSRNIVEGEAVLKAGLVILVGSRDKSSTKVSIFALVLQTSGLSKEPLQVVGDLIFTDESAMTLEKMECSCKAGLSQKCKHIGAVLWYLNRNDIHELEELSATDVRCMWSGKRKKGMANNYEAKKIRDFCCVKKAKMTSVTNEAVVMAHELLLKVSPGSAFLLHRAGRQKETEASS